MNKQPFIAAFDLATATGACDGIPGMTPRVWTWFLDDAGKSRPVKLCYLRRLFDEYFAAVRCDAVYYEAPMNLRTMMKIGTAEDGIALLRGTIGVLEACAAHASIPIIASVAVQDAREALTGQRRFKRVKGKSTAKDEIVKTATMMGVDVATDHEADAYAVWWYACAKFSPQIAHLSQPLFAR